jgi:hypothetical protein
MDLSQEFKKYLQYFENKVSEKPSFYHFYYLIFSESLNVMTQNIKINPHILQKDLDIFKHNIYDPLMYAMNINCYKTFNYDVFNMLCDLTKKIIRSVVNIFLVDKFDMMIYDDLIVLGIFKLSIDKFDELKTNEKFIKTHMLIIQDMDIKDMIYTNDYGSYFLYIKKNIQYMKQNFIELIKLYQDLPKKAYKKKQLQKHKRYQVWNKYIGKEKGCGPCFLCEETIYQQNFECGHDIAESKGGDDSIENLRAICGPCNKGQGTTRMNDYKKQKLLM